VTAKRPGHSWPVDDTWRLAIRDRAERKWGRGWQSRLAEKIGCTPPAISGLMSLKTGAASNSELVAAIHDALEIPPPAMATVREAWMVEFEREAMKRDDAEEFVKNLVSFMRAARNRTSKE
jgi:hypothetical protein